MRSHRIRRERARPWRSDAGAAFAKPSLPFRSAALQGARHDTHDQGLWRGQSSGWKNFNWNGVIDRNSVVHIAASEGVVNTTSIFGALASIDKQRGDATIQVKNVRTHDNAGGVEFFLQVDWRTPLDIVTDITVVEPPEQGVIVG